MAFQLWPIDVVMRGQGHWFRAAILAAYGAAAVIMTVHATEIVPLALDLDRPRALAVSANGQMVMTIGGQRPAIMAGDPSSGDPWREIVAGAGEGLPQPVAVGCVSGDVVAAVCRDGVTWMLQTYRMKPDTSADPGEPLQVVPLGRAEGEASDVALAVNHSRGWLVVTGLPAPLSPVLRCAIAGVRIGPPSDRACPMLPDHHRPVAVATRPAGDIVLVLRSEPGSDVIAFYDSSGRELLRLPTGLKSVSAIDIGRGDHMLWALGVSAGGHTGLWRLDAAFQDNRQSVQPVLIRPLTAPTAMVSVTDRAIVVIEGKTSPRVSRVHPPMSEESDSRRDPP